MRHLLRACLVMGAAFFGIVLLENRIQSAGAIQEKNLQEAQTPSSGDWYVNLARPGRPVTMSIPDFDVGTSDAAEAGKTIS
ncbi:MAG TPA: hypothetical protein VIE88_17860, partial [Vicinamibacteria bacterium]